MIGYASVIDRYGEVRLLLKNHFRFGGRIEL